MMTLRIRETPWRGTGLPLGPVLALLLAPGIRSQDATRRQPPSPSQYRDAALLREGDGERGRRLFEDDPRVLCSRCHTTDGSSSKAGPDQGPDLFAIGDKFGRRELIEAILSPSKDIAVGYSTTLIESLSGETYDGIVKETSGNILGLVGADGILWRIIRTPAGDRKSLFLDTGVFQKGTRGLLGMAMHPQFRSNHRYFIARHGVRDGRFSTRILEYRAGADLESDSGTTPRLVL